LILEIKIIRHLLDASEKHASEIRDILTKRGIPMLNMIGSPGCGKTTLLEKTLVALAGTCRCAVIEGDVATDRDAVRLQKYDVPICLINTKGACHLEPLSIRRAIDELDLGAIDLIFVENVGNLVCPAEFDIGEYAKIAVSSVAEGDDKPEKYPLLFNECAAVVLNKTDLLAHTDFRQDAFRMEVKKLNGTAPVFEISCRENRGLEEWLSWVTAIRNRVSSTV